MKVQFYKKMFNGEMRDFARIPVTDTKDILETPVKANSKSSTKKTQEKKDK
jgi:hypothetical protein